MQQIRISKRKCKCKFKINGLCSLKRIIVSADTRYPKSTRELVNGFKQRNEMYWAISLWLPCQQLKQEKEEIGWEQMIIVFYFGSGNLDSDRWLVTCSKFVTVHQKLHHERMLLLSQNWFHIISIFNHHYPSLFQKKTPSPAAFFSMVDNPELALDIMTWS